MTQFPTGRSASSPAASSSALLARALAQEAEIVLLDEPLTGLDAPSQEIMLRLVEELHGRGITILVATHDLQQAADQFPLVALLNHRLVAFGTPRAVLTTPDLLQAYGGQMHVIHTDTGDMLLTDTCCGGGEPLALPGELGGPPRSSRRRNPMELVHWFTDPLAYDFMVRALAAAVIVGILCPVVGSYMVLKGLAFFGDALSH